LLFLLLLTFRISPAQIADAKKVEEKADEYMKAAVKHEYFSGAVLIAKNGIPIFSEGYGIANHEHQVPITVNTVFLIGSLTKQFTSLAIMQLVEQGKLKVSDPLCNYLDNCPQTWKGIAVQNLLTHTSGILNISKLPDWDEKHSIQPYTNFEVVNLVKDVPLLFEPGEKYKYSNTNYILLGLIIEKLSGKSYPDYIEENILRPTGMQKTTGYNPRLIIPNKASGYYSDLNSFVNAPYENIGLKSSSGAMYSTVGDLLLWDQVLYSTKLLSSKGLEEIFTAFKDNYGYGWEIRDKFSSKTYSHSGSLNGFSSYLFRFPAERVTIIVLSNSDKASAGGVAHALSAIVFDKPYQIPEMKVYEMLSQEYETHGIDATLKLCRDLKKQNDKRYKIDEDILSDFGYDLLDMKKTKDAIKMFLYTLEENPKSSYAHDYVGEAYLHDKNYEQAMVYFKKALELDPDNDYAANGIKKVERALNSK
jgi:CubicO group peptidase (beta-lactamase class C family)